MVEINQGQLKLFLLNMFLKKQFQAIIIHCIKVVLFLLIYFW